MLRIYLIVIVTILTVYSCKERKRIGEKQVVQAPAQIDETATEIIEGSLNEFLEGLVKNDSFQSMRDVQYIKEIYSQNNYTPLWSKDGKLSVAGDSLYNVISQAMYLGLFPNDYFSQELTGLRSKLTTDTASKENKLDASLWAQTDLYLSMAFVQLIKDLKNGRIKDSVTLKKDSLLADGFILQQFQSFTNAPNPSLLIAALEPKHSGYLQLKSALNKFVQTADFKSYTYIKSRDSLNLLNSLKKRLIEDSILLDSTGTDSLIVANGIRQFQKSKGLKIDGKITSELINRLNNTDREKFLRIAITLDRYKQLPDTLPGQYIWVNIPSYYMQLRENDTIRLLSKIVVGKPQTRTPVITSRITNMITYPQWTIPASIIKKEILPGLKKDRTYTLKKGFSLIDKDGNVIDPTLVDWSKYKEGIPYKVVQGSGDDNALGVMKFNFSNKYDVYLHDTNQRYLFSKKSRALSHGCVRVQNWDSLAYFILKNDSLNGFKPVPVDTLKNWLALKEKHVIPVQKRIPLFIRYFTCDVKDEKVIFYDDVYGEDRRIKEKYFANKN